MTGQEVHAIYDTALFQWPGNELRVLRHIQDAKITQFMLFWNATVRDEFKSG